MEMKNISDPYAVALEQIDVSDPRLFRNNTAPVFFERLRREAPVHYCAGGDYGPFWSVTKYEDIMAVDTRHDVFSSDHKHDGHMLGYERLFRGNGTEAPMFIAMDPPKHDVQRKAVTPVVGPANLKNMEGLIRERCGRILDSLPVGETFDWVDKVSIELTTQTLATLFDFPWENRRLLTRWSDAAVSEPGLGVIDSWEERKILIDDCVEHFSELWRQRLAAEPGFDLISLMAHSKDTRNMSPGEFLGNVLLLIVGGNDTTRNSLSGGVLALNENPLEYDKLRANPALIESMVPEIIRWQTPLAHMARRAVTDATLGGKLIKAGDRVVMWYMSGNRDSDAIESADEFIIDRKNPRRHLSFGFGIHRCVGNRLAELQLRIAWEEIMQRFRFVEVVAEPERTCSNIIHGYTKLPVRVHPL